MSLGVLGGVGIVGAVVVARLVYSRRVGCLGFASAKGGADWLRVLSVSGVAGGPVRRWGVSAYPLGVMLLLCLAFAAFFVCCCGGCLGW